MSDLTKMLTPEEKAELQDFLEGLYLGEIWTDALAYKIKFEVINYFQEKNIFLKGRLNVSYDFEKGFIILTLENLEE